MPDTRGYQIAKTAKNFPEYCNIPAKNAKDTAIEAAQDLVTALTKPHTNKLSLTKIHRLALEKMATIFEEASSPLK